MIWSNNKAQCFPVGKYMFRSKVSFWLSSSPPTLTLLWLVLFRCLRKHQLPIHLRPTISVEQLLSFLCHNNSHSVDTGCQHCKISHTKRISLSRFFPSPWLPHWIRGHTSRFVAYAMCEPKFQKQAKEDIKRGLIYFLQSVIEWKQFLYFNRILTLWPAGSTQALCGATQPGAASVTVVAQLMRDMRFVWCESQTAVVSPHCARCTVS